MENVALIQEIYFALSEETQLKLVNSAHNLRVAAAEKGEVLSIWQAMYVIFEIVRFTEGKDIKQ